MIAQPDLDLRLDQAKLGKSLAALRKQPSMPPVKEPEHYARSPIAEIMRFERDVENSKEFFELFRWMLAVFKQAGLHDETAKQVDERMGDYAQALAEGNRLVRLLGERVDILTRIFHGLTHWIKQSGNHDQTEEALKRSSQIRLHIKQYDQLFQEFDQNWGEELLAKILIQVAKFRTLSAREKIFLLDAAKIDVPIKKMPSMRREDWYGDDGR